jgi:hypothetical protein
MCGFTSCGHGRKEESLWSGSLFFTRLMRLIVDQLPSSITIDDLEQLFSKLVNINEIYLSGPSMTGHRSLPMIFITHFLQELFDILQSLILLETMTFCENVQLFFPSPN